MEKMVFGGIFSIGFVFGYLLYYSVRHTKEFSIELLASAIGAVGGGAVVGLLGGTPGWVGPYGLGLAAGFTFYLLLAVTLISTRKFTPVANNKVMLVSQTLVGAPRESNS